MGRDVRLSRAFRRSRRYKDAATELGAMVRWLRRNRNWTLERASERMRLDFRHLQQIEAGTVNVTLATVLRISDAFGVSPSVILPGTKNTKPKLGPGGVLRVSAIRGIDPPGMKMQSGQFLENPIEPPPPMDVANAKKTVGLTVKQFRRAKKLTQKKLAAALTVTVQYIQQVEGGKQNLSIESLIKFARALEIDWRKLVVPD